MKEVAGSAAEEAPEQVPGYYGSRKNALLKAFGRTLTLVEVTLADGCRYGDFRFKKDSTTRISSRNRAVQDAIDEIRDKETAPAAAGGR